MGLNIFISNGQAQQHHPKRTSPQALVQTEEPYSSRSARCQAPPLQTQTGQGCLTLLELKTAGLSARFARTVGISVDHRRTNANDDALQLNVERLNTYKNKLILWPRVEGKPKKGQIDDSTADKLKSAAAGTQPSGRLLPRGRPDDTVETVKITAELQKVNPYRKTRTLRTIKRYNGRRIKRAEEAAAEEK